MRLKEKLKKVRGVCTLINRMRTIRFDIKNGINIRKTLILNFKFLPFKTAVRFPIIVYGRLYLANTSGTLEIRGPVNHRMIKWGLNIDKFAASKGGAMLDLQGSLVFNGPALLSVDCTVNVGKNGILIFGKHVYCGNGVKVRCWKCIEIGDYTDISLESQIFDTDFHYMRILSNGYVPPCSLPVKIGRFCWTGSRVTILKGSVVPDYTVIATESLLTKDYTPCVPQGSLIGGIPAKLLDSGKVRLHDSSVIKEADAFYSKQMQSKEVFKGTPGWMDDRKEVERFYREF